METQTDPISSDFDTSELSSGDLENSSSEQNTPRLGARVIEEGGLKESNGSIGGSSTSSKSDGKDASGEKKGIVSSSSGDVQTDAITKLRKLLEALNVKEKEVKKKEADHLHKAQALLTEMNKSAAFAEFKSSKACKEQLQKLKSAYDAASKQLALLTKQLNGGESSSESDSPSDDSTTRAQQKDTPEDSTTESEALSPVKGVPAATATLSRVFIDQDEMKLLAALTRETGHPKSRLTHTHIHPMQRAESSGVSGGGGGGGDDRGHHHGNGKGVDMRDLDDLFKRPTSNDADFFQAPPRRRPPRTTRRRAGGGRVSDDDGGDSDVDLENYIRKWRRSRDEDVLGVLKALRRENKLLKKKLKQERLRIGIELRRVVAANKVLEDQNRSMQELLVRAKLEIQQARAPKKEKEIVETITATRSPKKVKESRGRE